MNLIIHSTDVKHKSSMLVLWKKKEEISLEIVTGIRFTESERENILFALKFTLLYSKAIPKDRRKSLEALYTSIKSLDGHAAQSRNEIKKNSQDGNTKFFVYYLKGCLTMK